MCRLLCVHSQRPFAIEPHLDVFAAIARDSREYQGHGWGCAWLEDGQWRLHHDIRPVWEDRLDRFGETTLLLAHARSAFRDEGICVDNNMPFDDGRHVFIFNGELRGVRIREQGRIGAEKVFNYVKRFDRGDMHEALERGLSVIEKRTRYVRAMNVILASTIPGPRLLPVRRGSRLLPVAGTRKRRRAGRLFGPVPRHHRLVTHRQRRGADARSLAADVGGCGVQLSETDWLRGGIGN